MGASGSSELQVNFNRPSLVYYTDEQISGTISFQNTQDKLTLDAIILECVGEMGFITQETRQYIDSNGRTQHEPHTQNHVIPFLNIRIPVAQPQYGQCEITLYRGQHSWPFEFRLPPCLPPSLLPATVAYPYVKYYTRIVLDQPWYKPNAKQIYPLTIFPRVDLLNVPGGQQPMPFQNQNRKKIRLQGYLIRGGVAPGDKLSFQIDLQNPRRAEIKKIEATFVQHRQVGISCQTETIFRVDLPDIRDYCGTVLQRTFNLVVAAFSLSPTYTYLLPNSRPPTGVSIRYELILDVKVRGLFTDFKVTVPVIVGTEPASAHHQQQQQQMNSSIEMPTASAPPLEYDEPPPSYESLVTDQKM